MAETEKKQVDYSALIEELYESLYSENLENLKANDPDQIKVIFDRVKALYSDEGFYAYATNLNRVTSGQRKAFKILHRLSDRRKFFDADELSAFGSFLSNSEGFQNVVKHHFDSTYQGAAISEQKKAQKKAVQQRIDKLHYRKYRKIVEDIKAKTTSKELEKASVDQKEEILAQIADLYKDPQFYKTLLALFNAPQEASHHLFFVPLARLSTKESYFPSDKIADFLKTFVDIPAFKEQLKYLNDTEREMFNKLKIDLPELSAQQPQQEAAQTQASSPRSEENTNTEDQPPVPQEAVSTTQAAEDVVAPQEMVSQSPAPKAESGIEQPKADEAQEKTIKHIPDDVENAVIIEDEPLTQPLQLNQENSTQEEPTTEQKAIDTIAQERGIDHKAAADIYENVTLKNEALKNAQPSQDAGETYTIQAIADTHGMTYEDASAHYKNIIKPDVNSMVENQGVDRQVAYDLQEGYSATIDTIMAQDQSMTREVAYQVYAEAKSLFDLIETDVIDNPHNKGVDANNPDNRYLKGFAEGRGPNGPRTRYRKEDGTIGSNGNVSDIEQEQTFQAVMAVVPTIMKAKDVDVTTALKIAKKIQAQYFYDARYNNGTEGHKHSKAGAYDSKLQQRQTRDQLSSEQINQHFVDYVKREGKKGVGNLNDAFEQRQEEALKKELAFQNDTIKQQVDAYVAAQNAQEINRIEQKAAAQKDYLRKLTNNLINPLGEAFEGAVSISYKDDKSNSYYKGVSFFNFKKTNKKIIENGLKAEKKALAERQKKEFLKSHKQEGIEALIEQSVLQAAIESGGSVTQEQAKVDAGRIKEYFKQTVSDIEKGELVTQEERNVKVGKKKTKKVMRARGGMDVSGYTARTPQLKRDLVAAYPKEEHRPIDAKSVFKDNELSLGKPQDTHGDRRDLAALDPARQAVNARVAQQQKKQTRFAS